ncbi:MAG: NUDIX hydrolase [Pseudomonadota bacterium]
MSAIRSLHRGEFLEILRDRHWEYVRRTMASGAVVIIAVTGEGELVLVEQTRIPLQGKTIELPAGIVGDSEAFAGEAFETAALRELLEETGFSASRAEVVTQGPTAAGFSSEMLTFVRAHGLVREHAGGGVDDEDITVHLVALDAVHGWLEAKRAAGYFIEPRIYTGLWFAQNS